MFSSIVILGNPSVFVYSLIFSFLFGCLLQSENCSGTDDFVPSIEVHNS